MVPWMGMGSVFFLMKMFLSKRGLNRWHSFSRYSLKIDQILRKY